MTPYAATRRSDRNSLADSSMKSAPASIRSFKTRNADVLSAARVAEVLNRVRPLSLEMIRSLAEGLKIPADVLVKRYQLAV